VGALETVRTAFARQADRAFLWLVLAFAGGVALFFTWRSDPSPFVSASFCAAGLSLFISRRRLIGGSFVGLAIIAFGLGHGAAHIRTAAVATPLIERETRPFTLVATVAEAAKGTAVNRLVLANFTIPDLPPRETPQRLRITVPASHGIPAVGARISVRAVVRPAAMPVMPDGFQFQRFLYFGGIGGVGYTVGRWQLEAPLGASTPREKFKAWTEGLRRTIGNRIAALIPGPDGAVAGALVNGEQSAIPEDLQEAYRISGIAHLLSISGVHMSLLAGVVFFVMRRLLALVPYIALRLDTKKAAAWAGLGATGFYLVISGMSVPAIRSFLMIAVVMVAILLDRTALSVRTIGWAALVVMTLFPDAVFGASFQMSFLAVLALVALYEQTWMRLAWRNADGEFLLVRAAAFYLAALVVTDLVAGGTTALFAAYHFNRLPTYSALTNLVAVPLTGLWIMPSAVLGLILMPLGLDEIPLKVMGAGVALLNDIVRAVAMWPGAQVHVPPMATWAMIMAAFGVVFVCVWRGRERWLGFAAVVPALLQPYLASPPDIVVDESARVFAASDDGGGLVFKPGRTGRFVREAWAERYGASSLKWAEDSGELALSCDADGCVVARSGQKVLLAFTPTALAEDCGTVATVVSATASRDLCRRGRIVDIIDLRRDGTTALWMTEAGVRSYSVKHSTGDRVWMRGVVADDDDDLSDQLRE